MQINLQKTFYPSVGCCRNFFFPPRRKPIYVPSGGFCLEIASVHGWLALHFVFGDWQCPAGQFLEDSPCSVWRSSAIDFLPALHARAASQRREQWDVVGSERRTCDAWQTGNWCHWRGERGPGRRGHTPTLVFITRRKKKRDRFKLKSNVARTLGGELLKSNHFFFFCERRLLPIDGSPTVLNFFFSCCKARASVTCCTNSIQVTSD